MSNKKKFSSISTIYGVIIFSLILGGFYYVYKQNDNNAIVKTQTTIIKDELKTDIQLSPAVSSSTKASDNKYCEADENCGLLICSGCFNKEWLKSAPPDLACEYYSGYKCKCINNRCSAVK